MQRAGSNETRCEQNGCKAAGYKETGCQDTQCEPTGNAILDARSLKNTGCNYCCHDPKRCYCTCCYRGHQGYTSRKTTIQQRGQCIHLRVRIKPACNNDSYCCTIVRSVGTGPFSDPWKMWPFLAPESGPEFAPKSRNTNSGCRDLLA